ncbi:helix-turn-helix domain-containing protein [Nitratireductor sp. PBL-C9]|uniref:AraC family transcriptional regulator n=1 Tax=Nitratireductor sp. PBL-C9 TaxID=3435013 RepID=UPI003D7D3414
MSERAGTGFFSTEEPSLYEAAIRPWNLTVEPLEAGPFGCDIAFLKLDGIAIYRDQYHTDMRLRGTTPPDALALALPLAGLCDKSAFWGRTLCKHNLHHSFYRELDSTTAAGHDQIVILIGTDERYAPEFADLWDHFDACKNGRPIHLTDRQAGALRRVCLDALHTGEGEPDRAFGDMLRADLVGAIKPLVLEACRQEQARPDRRGNSAIARMYDFLEASDEPRLTVAGLCRMAGIHERTLERAVRAKFDCTVHALLRRRRLHEARRMLLFADAFTNNVTRISHELGFYDGGRFARDYAALFGELPSQTLRQNAIETVTPLLV